MDYIGPILFFAFLILLFNDQHWGPGLRNILNAVAYRIRNDPKYTQAPSADKDTAMKRVGYVG